MSSSQKINKSEEPAILSKLGEMESLLPLKEEHTGYQRWIMLFIFSLNTMVTGLLFIGISPKSIISGNYYKTTELSIQLLNNIFPIVYIFAAMPGSYAVFKMGIRPVLLAAGALNVVGTAFHLVGYGRNGFCFLIIGQIFAAVGNSAILQLPTRLSSQWFNNNERGKATAIGYFMTMIGVAFGFLQNTLMIPTSKNLDNLHKPFQTFFLSRFIFVIFTFLLALIFFKNEPSSQTQFLCKFVKNKTFLQYLLTLLTDKYFLAMSQSYSIYFGLIGAISLLLNSFMNKYKRNFAEYIGWMGVPNIICGIFGCLIFGVILDKLKKHRCIAVFINCSSMIMWLVFITTLKKTDSFFGAFAIFSLFGIVAYPYITIGLEQSAEMTYPVPEESSSAFILILAHVYGLIFGLVFGYFIRTGLVETVSYIIAGLYLLATLLTWASKTDLKRFSAESLILSEKLFIPKQFCK